MQKNPLKELKSFYNEIICKKNIVDVCKCKIKSFSQIQIIKYLIDNKEHEIYQKDFEKALNIRKSTVSGILNTMEKNNIIRRLHSDKDSRGKIIVLTEEALLLYKNVEQEFDNLNYKIIKDISEDYLQTFYKVLDKMKKNIQQEEI